MAIFEQRENLFIRQFDDESMPEANTNYSSTDLDRHKFPKASSLTFFVKFENEGSGDISIKIEHANQLNVNWEEVPPKWYSSNLDEGFSLTNITRALRDSRFGDSIIIPYFGHKRHVRILVRSTSAAPNAIFKVGVLAISDSPQLKHDNPNP